jgi:hypothetical protein
MLAEVLGQAPSVLALHEPLPHLHTEAYARWSGDHRLEEIRHRVEGKRLPLVTQVNRNGFLYVETSHFCSHLIAELDQIFSPKFVHLHRDGRAFARSGLHRGFYGQADASGLNLSARAKRRFRHRFLVDVGNPGLDHRLSPPQELRTQKEKVAWLWTEINRVILDGLDDVPQDRRHTIRLEDFDEGEIRRLNAFLSLPDDPAVVDKMRAVADSRPNSSRSRSEKDSWSNWDDSERQRFAEIAGGMMTRLGYSF